MASTPEPSGKPKREARPPLKRDQKELAARIEHTALGPGLLLTEVEERCSEARTFGFAGVCVPPYFVEKAAALLEGSKVQVVTVAGFPMGYQTTSAKVEEARKAFEQGANELDMVINLAALKNGRWGVVRDDIQSLATLAGINSRVLKVIVETAMLTEEELIRVCAVAAELGVQYVKTSTGFHGPGASVEAVRILRRELPKSIRIKASGGIRTRSFAEELIAAGADRIGTSNGVALLDHAPDALQPVQG
jgi:deoxyribose-phosphate aldolase